MNAAEALDALRAVAQTGKADEMAAYHKVGRTYLGVANPDVDTYTKAWRAELTLEDRIALASELWGTDIHEARVAAAKLFTQARIRPDDTGVWDEICRWVPSFDAWAIADHASIAGAKRLVWDPSRLDTVEIWPTSDHMGSRRAARVMTLPWARMNTPKPHELEARERILGWAAAYVPDQDWFIQKAVAWWLRDLSKRAPDRTRAFLDIHGDAMKPFARREASRYLKP